jgi:FtsP/CotA-like multicopper oxidase with cupredoxin domain
MTILDNNTTIRKFTLIADDFNGSGKPIVISSNVAGLGKPIVEQNYQPVIFHAWTFNGTVPGPTLRVTVGDHVQLTLINSKDSVFAHSLHMHSMHPGIMDGMQGPAGMVEPGHKFVYNFTAAPVGVYPYHCHMAPVEEHISRGLYGMLIIDPTTPRPPAIEMVGTLNGYTYSYEGLNGSGHYPEAGVSYIPPTMQELRKNLTNAISMRDEGNGPDNSFYSMNGVPFSYIGQDMIHLQTHKEYRLYLLNMLEFDLANSFHIHGTMGTFTESGTLNSSKIYTDIVLLQQGDRGIFEFSYPYPGQFMAHSHINHFSSLGWTLFFDVSDKSGPFFTNMIIH